MRDLTDAELEDLQKRELAKAPPGRTTIVLRLIAELLRRRALDQVTVPPATPPATPPTGGKKHELTLEETVGTEDGK
jgi:hypothetical protein